jgi:hypothetical protein
VCCWCACSFAHGLGWYIAIGEADSTTSVPVYADPPTELVAGEYSLLGKKKTICPPVLAVGNRLSWSMPVLIVDRNDARAVLLAATRTTSCVSVDLSRSMWPRTWLAFNALECRL